MSSKFLRPTYYALQRPQFISPTRKAFVGAFQSNAVHMASKQEKSAGGPNKQSNLDEIPEWKKRAPYHIHKKSEDFDVRYEASCHCGKVEYQLSREKPLDSKLCHCTTCQTQHGILHPSTRSCLIL